jgi:hypothetical protein
MLLVLAAVLVVIVNAPQHERVSALDEYSYIDYMDKFPHPGVVRQGEEIGSFTRNYYMCKGVELYVNKPEYGIFGPRLDLCNNPAALSRDNEFPQAGIVSADIYTPAYFAVSWAVSAPLRWTGVDDRVLTWRLSGAFWLALAALLLYAGATRLGASRPSAWVAALTLTYTSAAYWSNTYVSTDATALFAGSLMLVLAVGVLNGRTKPWMFALASAGVTLLKLQNFLAVGAAVLFLTLMYLARRREHPRPPGGIGSPLLRSAALAVMASMVAQITWTLIRSRLAVGQPAGQQYASDWGIKQFLLDTTTFFPGSFDTFATVPDWSLSQYMINYVVKVLVVGAVVGALFTVSRRKPLFTLSASAVVVALAGAPVLGLMVWLATGGYVMPAPRYGISLIPFYLAVLALMVSKRPRLGAPAVVLASGTFFIALALYA